MSTRSTSARLGRPRSTSKHDIERAAFDLFARRGFEATTVAAIAAATGIGRRTFFRYFESKNDVVWGDFTEHLDAMRQQFDRCPAELGLMDAVRRVVVDFNRFDPAEVPWHRQRMELILRVSELQAHSTLRYAEWRQVVADFAGRRLLLDPSSLLPQTIGYAALGCALAAYEQWLHHPDVDLAERIDTAISELAASFWPDRS